MTSMTTAAESPRVRERRGQHYAQMGLVEMRAADHFVVTPPARLGESVAFDVTRSADGRLSCTCAEFEEMVVADPQYACDHIYAVHHGNFGDLGAGPRGSAKVDYAARSMADLVTPAQLTLIRQKARAARVNPDVACRLWCRLDTGDLSKLGAMAFIKHLESLAGSSAEEESSGA